MSDIDSFADSMRSTGSQVRLSIDLNADLGEGSAYDAELVPLVSSVNVSCGAHAGSAADITAALQAAADHGVQVGAHPSYPDRLHVGRRSLIMSPRELRDSLLMQLESLAEHSIRVGVPLRHVKPHGALYNDAARDAELAARFCDVITSFDRDLVVVGLAGSQLPNAAAEAGLRWRAEAFADRRYSSDGSLVSRSDPGALLDNPLDAAAQAISIIQNGQVLTADGNVVAVTASTLCIHGDTPGAPDFARALRAALTDRNITIALTQ